MSNYKESRYYKEHIRCWHGVGTQKRRNEDKCYRKKLRKCVKKLRALFFKHRRCHVKCMLRQIDSKADDAIIEELETSVFNKEYATRVKWYWFD